MDKIWLKNYQPGVPANIEDQIEKYLSIGDLLEESFSKYSQTQAFNCMGKGLTYQEVDVLSRQFASYLQNDLKLQKGDRVALMMPNILQYPVALFGVLRGGFVAVNVNPLYTGRELQHQLKDSGAKAIVVFENACHTLQGVLEKTDVKHVLTTNIGDMLGFPKSLLVNFVIKKVKKMVPEWSIPSSKSFIVELRKGNPKTFKKPEMKLEDIAFLQYTGGTTGVAKGAILTHKNIVANMCQARAWLSPGLSIGKEILISPLPLYHIFSLTVSMVFVSIGATNVLITNPRDMAGFIKELKKWKFTVLPGVNTLFNGLLNHPEFKTVDFGPMKIALGGGMAVQKAVADKWKEVTGKVLLEAYGLTETSPAACINPLNLKEYNGFIGMPISSTDVVIKDDNDKTLGIDEIGEICIKGPQVMPGYWHRDDETAKVMTADGFFKSGDIGFINNDGYVKIVDRKKDMILVSGFNVYPNEIEDVVATHPKVFEVAAIGVPDEKTTEAIKLFIVKKDESLTAEEIIAFCRKELTNYKVPKLVEFRTELPKTNVGKILRKDLRN
ncbi:AMP-binding protein [Bacteriovorax sp. PP10]|uniref:Long-chain-fatty-acid--CoA ligase n=1 Tax=Bacteriovorax antarcticus TaxID=3088717 RepID=A0ABU5VV07_9BACT|nr:AMP-binding protein [Bacteriovorax sp. PP10]MEA9356891.1 AMP-binding protein [Bacteriovorax sp. PP10]